MELTPIFVLLIIFGFIYAIVYLGVRKKERQMLLDRGVDASIFATGKQANNSLRFGLLFIGVAIGIFLGNLFSSMPAINMDEEPAYFSMVFLFGGIALVISYFVEKNDKDKDKLEKSRKLENEGI